MPTLVTVNMALSIQQPLGSMRATLNEMIGKMETKAVEELAFTDILDVPYKDFCATFSTPYKALAELKDREINLDSKDRVPRFRFVMFKGPKQFNKLVAKYNTMDPFKNIQLANVGVFGSKDDFSLIINFYSEMFGGGEYQEILKLRADNDCWHLILVGLASVKRKDEQSVMRLFNILGIVSFKVLDSSTIFLKWLAISPAKAIGKPWGKKKPDQSGFTIFDSKSFKFKGIGSSLMLYMQELGIMIGSFCKSSLSQQKLPKIVLESSNEAVAFYKYGLGFMESGLIDSKHFTDAIHASDLTKLTLLGKISSGRPLVIADSLPPVDLLDNVIHWLYGVKNEERPVNYTGEFLFTGKRKPLKMFHEVTFAKNPQKSLVCSVPAGSTPLQRSVTLLSRLLGIKDNKASLHIVPTKYVGLFILRCMVYNHILANATTITNFFDKASASLFFDTDALHGFEKERQLVATMCWFLAKMKNGIPTKEYENLPLFTRKFDRTKQSNVSWFDEDLLKRPPSPIESMFMFGNIIDQLIAGFKSGLTKNPEVDTEKCSPFMLHFWLQQLGQEMVKRDASSDGDYFLSFISCLFKINITRISFKKKKQSNKGKKSADSWDISYSHCNMNPESDNHVAQLILCNVFPSKNVYDPNEVEWSILFDESCDVSLLTQNLASISNDESKLKAIQKSHADLQQYNTKYVEAIMDCHYEPLPGAYGLHCLCLKACLMDNEDWPYSLVDSYVLFLQHFKLIDNNTYTEVLTIERVEAGLDPTCGDLSSFRRFAVIYYEDGHFIVCVFTKEAKTIEWYDSQPIAQKYHEDTLNSFLARYQLLELGNLSTWSITPITSCRNFVRDCGPISLEDYQIALNVPGCARYTDPLDRKIALIKNYVKMYIDYFKDNNSEHVKPIPRKQREKVFVNMEYMAKHLERNMSLYQGYGTICQVCDTKFSMQETLIVRNCSKFCTYHHKCFMENFHNKEECSICQVKGCSYTKYSMNLEKNDNQFVVDEVVQWKLFVEGFEYGGLQIGRMFNEDELYQASNFVSASDLELAKVALDPRHSDKEYVNAVYEEVVQYRIMTLRPEGWLSCDVINCVADLLVQQKPGIKVVLTYYAGKDGKVNFNFDEMEEGNIYMFLVNELKCHWAVIECHGKSHKYNCYGFLESNLKTVSNLFKTFFHNDLPSQASFEFGPGFHEYQDGSSCGIVVLRRIQVRAEIIDRFDRGKLDERDFSTLGNYNCSRILFAAMVAQRPSTKVSFTAEELATVGQGNANSPLKYSSPEHLPPIDHAVSGVGTSTSPFDVNSQADSIAVAQAKPEENEDEAISDVESEDDRKMPASNLQKDTALSKQNEDEAISDAESEDDRKMPARNIQPSEDPPGLAFSGEEDDSSSSEPEDNTAINKAGSSFLERSIAGKRKRVIAEEVQDNEDEASNYDEDEDNEDDEPQLVGANSQGKILRRKQKPKAVPQATQPPPPKKASPRLRIKLPVPTKTPKNRGSCQKTLPLKKRQKRQQQAEIEAEVVQAKDRDMDDFLGSVVYPFDKRATELKQYAYDESFFKKIENVAENIEKYDNLVHQSILKDHPLNETTDCMIEKLCNAKIFKAKFENKNSGYQRQNVFKEEDWDLEELKEQSKKRFKSDFDSIQYDAGPIPHTNEIFFRHPNSLIAIRYQREVGKAPFEAITAPVFGDDKKTSLTVRVTEQWVKEHFDKAFVEALMKHKQSCDFVHFTDPTKNVTEETLTLAKKRDNRPVFYELNMRGGGDTMLIMKLKLKATYHSNNVMPTTEVWMIRSVDKELYLKERELERKRIERHRHNNLEQFYSDWLEIESDILQNEQCVGTETPRALKMEVQARRQAQAHANNQEYTYESRVHSFDIINMDSATRIVNVDAVPIYRAGLKQIAALRYDDNKEKFYGQVLESVTSSGQRKYTKEIFLNNDWVNREFTQEFIAKLKERAHNKKYIWVPCGKASKRKYPYKYNTLYPRIRYQQGTRDTCASSSLASCLHAMGYVDIAAWIESFGVSYVKEENESVNFLSSLMFNLQKSRKDFNKEYGFKKLAPNNFNIFQIDEEKRKYPKLLQLLGSDGGVAHAITIHDGLIYDSNLFRAVDLNQLNLEFCMDAVYTSIINGYELIPQKVLRKEALKNSKQKRNR